MIRNVPSHRWRSRVSVCSVRCVPHLSILLTKSLRSGQKKQSVHLYIYTYPDGFTIYTHTYVYIITMYTLYTYVIVILYKGRSSARAEGLILHDFMLLAILWEGKQHGDLQVVLGRTWLLWRLWLPAVHGRMVRGITRPVVE